MLHYMRFVRSKYARERCLQSAHLDYFLPQAGMQPLVAGYLVTQRPEEAVAVARDLLAAQPHARQLLRQVIAPVAAASGLALLRLGRATCKQRQRQKGELVIPAIL